MRSLFLLLALAACAKPVTPDLPYVEASAEEGKRVKSLRVLERGSGVVGYAVPPERISVRNPAVATVVRFDGERRFHVFGEVAGETVIVADLGTMRHQLPVEVLPSDEVLADLELVVGQEAGFAAGGEVHRVVIGDPAVLQYKRVGDLGGPQDAVQLKALRPGRTHVVVSLGEEAPPVFRWVVVK